MRRFHFVGRRHSMDRLGVCRYRAIITPTRNKLLDKSLGLVGLPLCLRTLFFDEEGRGW